MPYVVVSLKIKNEMFSHNTEFLTRRGWKLAKDLLPNEPIAGVYEDCLLFSDDYDVQMYDYDYPLYECTVGMNGRFCVSSDHEIFLIKKDRRSRASKGDEVELVCPMLEIIDKISNYSSMVGYVRSDLEGLDVGIEVSSDLKKLSTLFSVLFSRVSKIRESGSLCFSNEWLTGRSKDELVKTITDVYGDVRKFSRAGNNRYFEYEMSMDDLWAVAYLFPNKIEQAVGGQLYYNNDGKMSKKSRIRYRSQEQADLAQLSLLLRGYTAKIDYDESDRLPPYCLYLTEKVNTVAFRNKVIVLGVNEPAVEVEGIRPVTRYEGRVSIL